MILSKRAWTKAKKVGIRSKVQLLGMAESGSYVDHPKGNRKYNNYIFKIRDNIITDVVYVKDFKQDVCPDCKNDGYFCLTCGTF